MTTFYTVVAGGDGWFPDTDLSAGVAAANDIQRHPAATQETNRAVNVDTVMNGKTAKLGQVSAWVTVGILWGGVIIEAAPTVAAAATQTGARVATTATATAVGGAAKRAFFVGYAAVAGITSKMASCGNGCASGGSGGSAAAKGGRNAPKMMGHATQAFKNGPLTNVGRALTKHPNVIGESGNIVQKLGGAGNVNQAGASALRNIMDNGVRSPRMTRSFGQVVEFKLPSGIGAPFSEATNEFIGFLGRGL